MELNGYNYRMTDQAAVPHCALYARTSGADPAGALQFRLMRRFVRRRGWRVYGEFIDARYPGATDEQPALDELMHEASKHQFDCIVVTRLDRLAFSYAGLVARLQRLADLGVRFISVLQSVDTGEFVATADGSLVRTGDVLLSVARACSGFDSLREQPDRTPCSRRTGVAAG
jgi:site-specific DNA recombinase